MENKEIYFKLYDQVEKLKNSDDPKRKYEYILWLGKKLKIPNKDILIPENKVQGFSLRFFCLLTLLFFEGPFCFQQNLSHQYQ